MVFDCKWKSCDAVIQSFTNHVALFSGKKRDNLQKVKRSIDTWRTKCETAHQQVVQLTAEWVGFESIRELIGAPIGDSSELPEIDVFRRVKKPLARSCTEPKSCEA